ncbi:MAG: hypothetical protein K2W78_04050 [Xanthobacteraceae bacterium]|nr:hypothetical protein [Xanthobacteraceae bacterium]
MKKFLGLLAVAGLMFVFTPSQQADAMSLANPGAATAAKQAHAGLTTEVHWRRHGYRRHWRRHHWHRRHW